jgi:hypothetical protein
MQDFPQPVDSILKTIASENLNINEDLECEDNDKTIAELIETDEKKENKTT